MEGNWIPAEQRGCKAWLSSEAELNKTNLANRDKTSKEKRKKISTMNKDNLLYLKQNTPR